MAAAPAFAATPNNASAQISATADTSYTSPANTVTIFTAGASGSVVNEIDMTATGTTVAGVINVFRKNGANYYILDSFVVPVVTPSTTTAPYRASRTYPNLVLKSGDTLVASSWASSQLVCASAFGGDM
jgi:hypothetical protein